LCHGVLDFSTFRIQFLSLLPVFKERKFDKYSTMSNQERIDYFLQTDETYRMHIWLPQGSGFHDPVQENWQLINNSTLCGKYVNPVRVLHTPRGILHRNYFCGPVNQQLHIRSTGVNFDKLFWLTDFKSTNHFCIWRWRSSSPRAEWNSIFFFQLFSVKYKDPVIKTGLGSH
jgi:hypothetical protein